MVQRPLDEGQKNDIKVARVLRETLATPGWKVYCDLIQAHILTKERECEQPAEDLSMAMRQNAAKGAVLMGRLCLSLPSGIIQVADEHLTRADPDERLDFE